MSDIYKDNAIQTRAIYPTAGFSQYVILLVVSKFLHSFGLFLAYDLLKLLHVVQLLFFIKAGSAICFILLQKPFSSNRKITRHQWVRIWRHAFLNSLISLLWLFGLTLCGPLRTILLSEHADVTVIAGASALFTSNGGPAKVRGAVFFLICVVTLLLFDNDSLLLKEPEHPEGFEHQHHGVSHVFYYIISWIGVADHKGGVVLLFIVLCLRVGFNSAARKLSVDLGGSKRLNAVSTLISACMLTPWVIVVMYMQVNRVDSWFTLFIPISLVVIFGFVFDYYAEAFCGARLDTNKTALYGSIAVFLSGFFFSIFWNHPYAEKIKSVGTFMIDEETEDHMLSGGVIFSGVMVIFATSVLSSPSSKGTKGSFIGYSSSGQPLYNFSSDALQRTSQSLLLLSKNGLKQILEEPDSRKIFYFLCANLSFTFVELIYGVWTNSLGLISDGFHMLFDCSALVMGLFAALMSRWKATRIFSYGYGRVEVLSGFLNGLFLVVIAFFVFTEALSRLFDPPNIITERLLTVSLAGLVVNLMGILAFRHTHSHSSHTHHHTGHSHHGHSHGVSHHDHQSHHHEHGSTLNANMRGVFLHILADTLGSVGVIVSSLLIENFGWLIADPICSLFIAVLIFVSVLPLLKESALILLLRTPVGMEQELSEALQKVLAVEGILSFRDQHFWQHSAYIIAGTLHVQVMPDASEQKIIAQVTAIFKDCGVDNFTVQVEKEVYFQHMSALSSNFNQMINITPTITKSNFLSTANIVATA